MKHLSAICLIGTILLSGYAAAQESDSEADLAQQLANPVSSLISVPFQLNHDRNIGPLDDGDRWTLNIQPVILAPHDRGSEEYEVVDDVIVYRFRYADGICLI